VGVRAVLNTASRFFGRYNPRFRQMTTTKQKDDVLAIYELIAPSINKDKIKPFTFKTLLPSTIHRDYVNF